MKIAKPRSAAARASTSSAKSKPKASGSEAPKAAGWAAKKTASLAQKRDALVNAATHAVAKALDAKAADPKRDVKHPLVEKFGEGLGLALGVAVTEALALSKKWNAPLVDAKGQPVKHVEGADQQGAYPLRTRHQEVVGPKILEAVKKLPPGAVHDLVEGLGLGASAAPGTSYRLESALADLFKK